MNQRRQLPGEENHIFAADAGKKIKGSLEDNVKKRGVVNGNNMVIALLKYKERFSAILGIDDPAQASAGWILNDVFKGSHALNGIFYCLSEPFVPPFARPTLTLKVNHASHKDCQESLSSADSRFEPLVCNF